MDKLYSPAKLAFADACVDVIVWILHEISHVYGPRGRVLDRSSC
jgi:hypothetical protein